MPRAAPATMNRTPVIWATCRQSRRTRGATSGTGHATTTCARSLVVLGLVGEAPFGDRLEAVGVPVGVAVAVGGGGLAVFVGVDAEAVKGPSGHRDRRRHITCPLS